MANGEKKEGGSIISAISIEQMRANPWILATIFLAIVLVIALVVKSGSMTGNVVSENAAAQNLLSFIAAQGGGEAELVSVSQNGSLYDIVVNFQGEDIPVFVTLDGKYLVSSLIPIGGSANAVASGAQSQNPTEVPKSAKPKVELFVMALCPYGTQMEKGIIPVVNLLGNNIDFSLKFVSYAMHGKTEIDENTRQYCIQKEQNSRFMTYMACYLKDGNSDSCLISAGIDKGRLNSCIMAADKQFGITVNYENEEGWLSGQFPVYSVNELEAEQYGVQGSPTLVINGAQVSSGRDPASLLDTICAAFTDAPEECGNTLSSASPSPGFGYDTSAGGSADATCG